MKAVFWYYTLAGSFMRCKSLYIICLIVIKNTRNHEKQSVSCTSCTLFLCLPCAAKARYFWLFLMLVFALCFFFSFPVHLLTVTWSMQSLVAKSQASAAKWQTCSFSLQSRLLHVSAALGESRSWSILDMDNKWQKQFNKIAPRSKGFSFMRDVTVVAELTLFL